MTWPERARRTNVTDQVTYDLATEDLVVMAQLEKRIIEHHKPIKDAAFKAHKVAVAAERRLLDPLEEARKIYSPKIIAWDQEQERIRAEAQRKADEEAERLEQEARIQAAVDAEAQGATVAEQEVILQTPIVQARPVVPATYQKSSAVTPRKNWKARVKDFKALVKAVAEGKASINLLQPNDAALNAKAKAEEDTMSLPGVEAYNDVGLTRRT